MLLDILQARVCCCKGIQEVNHQVQQPKQSIHERAPACFASEVDKFCPDKSPI